MLPLQLFPAAPTLQAAASPDPQPQREFPAPRCSQPIRHHLQPPAEPKGSDACWQAGASQAEPQLQTLLTLCLPPASFGDQFGGQAKCPIPSPEVFGVPGLPTALCVPAGRLLCLMQVIVVEQSIPPALLLAARTTLGPPLMPSSIALTTESATVGLQRSAPYRC